MLHTVPGSCVLILGSLYLGTVFGQEKHLNITPDQKVQLALADALNCETWVELCAPLKQLVQLTEGNTDGLIAQLLFQATRFERGDSDERMTRLAVFRQIVLHLEIPPPNVVAALVPFLDSPEVEVRRTVRVLLRGYEDHSGARPPDFSIYQGILESSFRRAEEPSASLVTHMYEGNPSAALLVLLHSTPPMNIEDERAILLAEHTVSDVVWRLEHAYVNDAQARTAAVEPLTSLARSERWWVRCYVAYTMKAHPPLRMDPIVQVLKNDAHKTVQEALQFEEKQ